MKDGLYRRRIGNEGEDRAAAFLASRGYTIVERNYRACGGEIDIVARDGGTLVFVEVKTRRRPGFGDPEGWVDERKQRQIGKVAAGFLHQHGLENTDCRFDVIAVDGIEGSKIRHLKDAFWME